MRWLAVLFTGVMSSYSQWLIESPVTAGGFLGVARGANEVPARLQGWGGSFGINSVVREQAGGVFAGELCFWYARVLSNAPGAEYATGAIMVDVRGRVYLPVRMEEFAVFLSGGGGLLFPLNERVLEQPSSPTFEPNMPALHFPVGGGIQWRVNNHTLLELCCTYVLTTTDNLNAPHDGAFDGLLAITLGLAFRIGY